RTASSASSAGACVCTSPDANRNADAFRKFIGLNFPKRNLALAPIYFLSGMDDIGAEKPGSEFDWPKKSSTGLVLWYPPEKILVKKSISRKNRSTSSQREPGVLTRFPSKPQVRRFEI